MRPLQAARLAGCPVSSAARMSDEERRPVLRVFSVQPGPDPETADPSEPVAPTQDSTTMATAHTPVLSCRGSPQRRVLTPGALRAQCDTRPPPNTAPIGGTLNPMNASYNDRTSPSSTCSAWTRESPLEKSLSASLSFSRICPGRYHGTASRIRK